MTADLTCGYEKADRPTIGIRHGMKLGIHAAFRAANQAARIPLWDGPPLFPGIEEFIATQSSSHWLTNWRGLLGQPFAKK